MSSPRHQALEEAAKVADAFVARARFGVSNCRRWSPAQAEWSRARDLGLDIAEAIRSLATPDDAGEELVTISFQSYPHEVQFVPGPPTFFVRGFPPLAGEDYVQYGRRIARELGVAPVR